MRSLEEWTKYLEEQEQSLQTTLKKSAEKEEPVEKPRKAALADSSKAASTSAQPVKPAKKEKEKTKQKAKVKVEAPPEAAPVETVPEKDLRAAATLRKRLPERLAIRDEGREEVAQSSYTDFRETREELLQRLLDPQLTLEDTARILNVCPTTVRRYTNRGLLRHYRTAGNQRRFRLSDIMQFLESQGSSLTIEK